MTLLFLLSAQAATVSPDTVPAAEPSESLVTIEAFGRYAVEADSDLGAELVLVDRMAGPMPRRDGRLDVFLDRGEYKLRLEGSADDSGDIRLDVVPFVEQSPEPVALASSVLVSERLGDYEQRSYWVQVDTPEQLQVEAAGRHLTDMRLWQDGAWLHGAQPSCRVTAPTEGQPLRSCTLDVRLEPGLYQLTAYGGPGLDWTDGSDDAPLHLRRGVPDLGSIGQQQLTISPFGIDRFMVSASMVHLALPRPAAVRMSAWDPGRGPFVPGGRSTALTKESRYPLAALDLRRKRPWIVTVQGAAGQPYQLQHFTPTQPTTRLAVHSEPSWVTTMAAGIVGDQLDTTALILEETADGAAVVASSAIPLRGDVRYTRRANLPAQPVTLLLEVAEEGTWRFELGGVDGRTQVAPYLIRPPSEHTPPPFKRGPQEHTLSPGLYVLTIAPDEPGIGDIDIRPRRGRDSLPVLPQQLSAQFQQVATARKVTTSLQQFGDPTQKRGVIQRTMPLDLSEPLAVTLAPGEAIDLLLDVTERGGLVVDGAEGAVEVKLDREVFPRGGQVWPMRHDLRLTNQTDAPQQVVARLEAPQRALPSLPAGLLQSLPDFPEVTDGAAHPLDLSAGAQATMMLRVDEPALYEVSSEGLLAVQGTVRTRTTTRLDAQAQNGPGRNFLLQQYLREGEYQVTAQTLGRSAGHLRVRLRQTALRDGGTLQADRPARIALEAGEGVVYTLDVPEAGTWALRASAEGQIPRCRLEDAEGWPLIAPNQPADLSLSLEAGTYRLVLLPSSVDERRVTTLSPVRPEPSRAGHGPHPITLDTATAHRWLEPRGGDQRLPDIWTFSLAAPTALSVDLSDEMTAQLFHNNRLVDGLSGDMPAGDYQLAVRSQRPDHGRPYTVAVRADALTAGRSRSCSAPCAVPISAAGLTEISTAGDADVRLRLRDGEQLIADSDDRPGGWNAQLLADLPPKTYTLLVSPVGTERARTTVSVRKPTQQAAETLSAGATATLAPGDTVLEVPLDAPAGGTLLATAAADETVGIAIVQGGRVLSEGLGEIARAGAWIDPSTPASLRVWSVDRRGAPVAVSVSHDAPTSQQAGRLRAPVQSGLASYTVATPRGGAFRVSAPGDVRACTAPGQPCAPVDGLTATDGSTLVLIAEAPDGADELSLTVEEDILPTGRWTRIQVPATGARWEAARGRGPLLVIARSNQGQPGLRLAAPNTPRAVQAAGAHTAIAATLSADAPSLELWPAAGPGAFAVRVRAWRFEPPRSARAGVGQHDVSVAAGEAVRRTLSADQPATVDLPEGFAAIITVGDAEQVHYADGAAKTVAVDRAGSVTVLNPTDRSGIARVHVLAGADDALELREGAPLEPRFAHAHTRRIWTPARDAPGWQVRAAGAVSAVSWLGADGSVARGTDRLTLPAAGGWLEVDAEAGPAVLWLVSPGGESGLLANTGDGAPLALPARKPLSGTAETFTVSGDAGGVLQLGVASPAVVSVLTASGREETAVLLQGGSLDVPLSGGDAQVALRAIGGGTLSGTLSATMAAPALLADGVNPAVALSPGEHRWMSFSVIGEQEVGVGVQSDSDRVAVVLRSADGDVLGRGRVQLHTLPEGRYLLGLSLPSDARPATAQPALVGRDPRGSGPPEDIIRAYVEGR